MSDSNALPAGILRLFHEHRPCDLDPRLHQRAIIERVLDRGDLEEWRWIFQTYGEAAIAEVARTSRSLDPMTVGFLCLLLRIPRGETVCFSTRSLLTSGAFSRSWDDSR